MSIEKKNLATSLFKGLDLLTLLNSRSSGVGIYELVEAMSLPRSSLIRMLDSLSHYGLVERDSDKRYKVTPRFRDWKLEGVNEKLIARYQPLMRDICDEVGEMVVLGKLEGRRIRHIHCEEPDRRVRVSPPIGRTFRLEAMAMGKLAISKRSDLVSEKLSDDLLAKITEAGRQGFAWNRAESEDGIIAWATWLGEASTITPMLAVTWPEHRFVDTQVQAVIHVLKQSQDTLGPFEIFSKDATN